MDQGTPVCLKPKEKSKRKKEEMTPDIKNVVYERSLQVVNELCVPETKS